MSRVFFRVEFDGAPFCGWQMQAAEAESRHKPSLQATLETALSVALRRREERFVVHGCGRTDAGVHAEEYYCHVDLPLSTGEELGRLRQSLNAILPPEFVITQAALMPDDAHALEDVVSKTYEYRLYLRRAKPTLLRGRVLWLPLDPAAGVFDFPNFERAVQLFQGEHDFAPFASAHGTARTTVRSILRAEVVCEPDASAGMLVRVRFTGTGFLKQQVRTMVGTALEVAQGKRPVESVEKLLRSGGVRQEAGPCVAGEGLFLTSVRYEHKIPGL